MEASPKTSAIHLNLASKIETMENQLEQKEDFIRKFETNVSDPEGIHIPKSSRRNLFPEVDIGTQNEELYEEVSREKKKIQQRLERSELRRKKAAKKIRQLLKYKNQVDQTVILKKILQYLD